MNTKKVYHYVYRITNVVENKHYYGKRSSKNVKPEEDLGKNYFSSSTDLLFIQDQKSNPQKYKYKVVSLHSTASKALEKEIKLHHKFKVGVNTNFYNELATKNKVGAYLHNIQKSSITSLWEYANTQSSTERQNRQWFCKTFCNQNDIPIERTDSPWEYIKGFSLYDPVTAIWMIYPEYFQPSNLVINNVECSIVGISAENNGVKEADRIISKIKELVYEI